MVPNERAPLIAGCPIVACRVITRARRVTIHQCSSEDVRHVGLIATTIHLVTHLGKYGTLGEVWAVAMEVLYVSCYQCPLKIVPWSIADSIASVDAPRACRAQIGAPSTVPRAGRLCERLAMRVGTGKATEVGAIAETDAGDEETHRGGIVLLRHERGPGKR